MKDQILKLSGTVQHYAWGGFDFIPELLMLVVKENKPYAEYWLGAHPSSPSDVEMLDKTTMFLDAAIHQLPLKFLGEDVYNRFGELPYLLKVLDVAEMLSIQVHPTREEAAKGFDREEAAGVPIDAPHRNYKDRNHKPEVMIALSEFWLLHGFKQHDVLVKTLERVPQLNQLMKVYEKESYFGLYKHVMEMSQAEADSLLAPLVQNALTGKWKKDEPEHWVSRLYKGKAPHNVDRGIFSIYFFNIVNLQRGEAIFQAAGVPHAYLEGQNVELMANSDNVLRGGLTSKHIDVPELLKHTRCEGITPHVMKGDAAQEGERVFACPVEDFGIAHLQFRQGQQYTASSYSAEILLVTKGAVLVEDREFSSGQAFLVVPQSDYTILAKEDAIVFKAFVPRPV